MRAIRKILSELLGLFVDDGKFALAILSWLVLVGLAMPHLRMARAAGGLILFLGLGGILIESAKRYSKVRR